MPFRHSGVVESDSLTQAPALTLSLTVFRFVGEGGAFTAGAADGVSSIRMSVWEQARRDFPALERWVYLDTAAVGPTPRPVREAVEGFYRSLEEGGVSAWDQWMARREEVRASVADLIGAETDEIAFVDNTSAGMNLIADLLGGQGAVLSSELEFPAVTLPWIHRGIAVHLLPAADGIVRLESFEKSQAPRAAVIALSHVQFSNGGRLDLQAFGLIKAHRHLVVSGSQSVGVFPIEVRSWGVDALACAGHKWLCAGFGAGFVYISRALLEKYPPRTAGWMSVKSPFAFDNHRADLLPSNARTELGCPPFGPIFALGAAVDYIRRLGREAIANRVLELNMYLTSRLGQAGFDILSPPDPQRSGETLCAIPDPPKAVAFLRDRSVLVTVKPEGVRISTHFFNNEEDIDRCVGALVAYREHLS
jgi:cysteine desulfurase/selenocysteine lyase